ncbi:hypothetical protein MKW98_021456 [Papaver atlanticum]|uniref:Uncharacterized protein n=1 Tax=Papaver atlanticum TaxID=357466 RepID=A0AAD4XJ87_9MAGN|nr:hypothetical protein MKW98_021456 [Papaver atlanticum]
MNTYACLATNESNLWHVIVIRYFGFSSTGNTYKHDESCSTIAGGNQWMKAKDFPVHNGRDNTASSSSSPKALSSNCNRSQDLSATTGTEDDFDDFDHEKLQLLVSNNS